MAGNSTGYRAGGWRIKLPDDIPVHITVSRTEATTSARDEPSALFGRTEAGLFPRYKGMRVAVQCSSPLAEERRVSCPAARELLLLGPLDWAGDDGGVSLSRSHSGAADGVGDHPAFAPWALTLSFVICTFDSTLLESTRHASLGNERVVSRRRRRITPSSSVTTHYASPVLVGPVTGKSQVQISMTPYQMPMVSPGGFCLTCRARPFLANNNMLPPFLSISVHHGRGVEGGEACWGALQVTRETMSLLAVRMSRLSALSV